VEVTPLDVPGTWLCTHRTHADDRGSFGEWLRTDVLSAATKRTFSILQANVARSRRGVIRGIHYTQLPPGQAKYVYCASGSVLDIMVDIRVGSPTFGAHAAVTLSSAAANAVFMAEGIAHAYLALEDDTTVTYLVSSLYAPHRDCSVTPYDTDLALPWPEALTPVTLSEKDRGAPSLAEARDAGLLPRYDDCLAFYDRLAEAHGR
jgi:dTDP-4-dehydrorhamnose 3,5-epimerase